MRVSVVGLGPGPAEWISPAATSRLRIPGARVLLRTRFFPDVDQLLEGVPWESFDDVYERAESIAEVHEAIVRRLLEASDQVVYAVPGDGALGEAVVQR